MSALRELLAFFDVQVDDHQLEKFEKGTLAHTLDGLKNLGGVIAEAFAFREAAEFVHKQIEIGDELADTAERLGLTTDALQEFQFAAKLSGVDAGEAAHALGRLNRTLGEAAKGGEAAKAFKDLGVDVKDVHGNVREASEILPDLADGIQKAGGHAEQTAALMRVFGRSGMNLVPLFKDGANGLREMNKEFKELGGGMREDFIKNAKEASDALKKWDLVSQGLKSTIVNFILPNITKWLEMFVHWLAKIRKVIDTTTILRSVMTMAGIAGASAFYKIAMSLLKFTGLIGKADSGLWGLVKGLGKFGLYAAAIAGVVLLFDDLLALVNGDDSAIGNLLDSLGMTATKEQLIAQLNTTFAQLGQTWDSIKQPLQDLVNLIEKAAGMSLPFLAKAFAKAASFAADAIDSILTNIQALIASLKGDFSKRDQLYADEAIRNAQRNTFGNFNEDDVARFKAAFDENGQRRAFIGPTQAQADFVGPTAQQAGKKEINKTVSQQNQINIKVDARGKDGKEVGEATGEAVRKSLADERQDAYNAVGGDE